MRASGCSVSRILSSQMRIMKRRGQKKNPKKTVANIWIVLYDEIVDKKSMNFMEKAGV